MRRYTREREREINGETKNAQRTDINREVLPTAPSPTTTILMRTAFERSYCVRRAASKKSKQFLRSTSNKSFLRTRSFSLTTSDGAEEAADMVGDLDRVAPSY